MTSKIAERRNNEDREEIRKIKTKKVNETVVDL